MTNPVVGSADFQLAVVQAFPIGVAAGSQIQAKVSVASNYAGSVNSSCDASAISGQCIVTPTNPVAISPSAPVNLAVALNIPDSIAPGAYIVNLTVADASGQPRHTLQLPITVIQDFSVTSATSSQTLAAGQTTTGPYQLTVAPNPTGSSFSGAVTLSCSSGLPAGAHCIFAPSAPLTLGNSSAAVVMSVSTTTGQLAGASLSNNLSILYGWLLFPGIVLGRSFFGARSRKRTVNLLAITMLFLAVLSLLSCGGVSSGANTVPPPGNKPVVYQITVTGTAAGTSPDAGQSAVVILVVD